MKRARVHSDAGSALTTPIPGVASEVESEFEQEYTEVPDQGSLREAVMEVTASKNKGPHEYDIVEIFSPSRSTEYCQAENLKGGGRSM